MREGGVDVSEDDVYAIVLADDEVDVLWRCAHCGTSGRGNKSRAKHAKRVKRRGSVAVYLPEVRLERMQVMFEEAQRALLDPRARIPEHDPAAMRLRFERLIDAAESLVGQVAHGICSDEELRADTARARAHMVDTGASSRERKGQGAGDGPRRAQDRRRGPDGVLH